MDEKARFRYVYGPVPSRRLGRSLGMDLVPFKTCSYDCVYCQLGRTTNKTSERKEYVPIVQVLKELERKLATGPVPDYISLAGSGEPTLNLRMGDLIAKIKNMTEIPVAVLTNGSLLWKPEVQESLQKADLVLPSLDAGDERLFRYVNRPHDEITWERMITGLIDFRRHFPHQIWLEVFLLANTTGIPSEIEKIAAIVEQIRPERVQLNTVSRPPAEDFALAVSWDQMNQWKSLFPCIVDVIMEREPGELDVLFSNESIESDILALLSRRPCTVHGVSEGLGIHVEEATKQLQSLTRQGLLKQVRKDESVFYVAIGSPNAEYTNIP